MRAKTRNARRKVKHLRLRKKVIGTSERPRISIFKSNKNISAQMIDDTAGKTLVESSTQSLKLKGKKIENCKLVGADLAKKAATKGIKEAVFDTSGYKYHGRVAALADAARENGLKV